MGAGNSSTGKPRISGKQLGLRFSEIDKDGSGEVDVEELIEALKEFSQKESNNWPREDVEKVVHFFDKDHTGELDRSEYNDAVRELKRREAERATDGDRSRSVSTTGGKSGRKSAVSGGGVGGKSRKDSMEDERAEKIKAKEAERAARIAEGEKKRAVDQAKKAAEKTHKSKYSRSEIMIIFDLFNEYDEDGSGTISLQELKDHFDKRVEDDKYNLTDYKSSGERGKSLADRRASRANLDLAVLVQPMFESADKDNSGTIGFLELLSVLYPHATKGDMDTFKAWCYPEKSYVPPIQYNLSQEQHTELKSMFRVIDKDHSGEVSMTELKKMFMGSAITGETGISMEELQAYFDEADFDDSQAISIKEFEKLMISTGMYTPETLPDDVTEEQLKELEKEEKAALRIQEANKTRRAYR